MHKADGIGLAAPQIGKSIRLFVVDVSPIQEGAEPMVFLNVEILKTEGSVPYNEGCLSIPGVSAEVWRPDKIQLRFTDLDGREQEGVAEGILARVIQHETDHTDGKLFIDYLSPDVVRPFQPVLDQLVEKNEQAKKRKKR
jgi:peptide deformylase